MYNYGKSWKGNAIEKRASLKAIVLHSFKYLNVLVPGFAALPTTVLGNKKVGTLVFVLSISGWTLREVTL